MSEPERVARLGVPFDGVGQRKSLWDFFAHLAYTVMFNSYSPGLVSSSLLYYPIPIYVTVLAVREGRLTLAGSLTAYTFGGLLILAVIWGGVYHFTV